MRDNDSNWLVYTVNGVNQAELHKYKVLITSTGVELFIDDVTRGTKALVQPIRISHIANAYGGNFVNASVKDFTIHTDALGTLSSSDIFNDLACHNCTTTFVDEPPVITLNGDPFMNIPLGEQFVDPGATVVDDVDDNLSATATGTVDTNRTGRYHITYTATDSGGNTATTNRIVQVELGVDSGETATEFNGVNAYATLDKTYILQDDGDYIEFEAKWNDMDSAYQGTLGLFGVTGGGNQTMGWNNSSTFAIRGSSSTWMSFTPSTPVNQAVYNRYKVLINGTNVELYINDVLQGSTALIETISIRNIGNTYGASFVNASVKNVNIHTLANGTLYSTDINNDLDCVNCTTSKVYKNQIDSSYMLLNIQDKDITIYKPYGTEYIAYNFFRIVNDSTKADSWLLGRTYLTDENFATKRTIVTSGNWETAIRISGASDFMGSAAHGDELLTDFSIELDGHEIDYTEFGFRKTKQLDIYQDSNLFAPDGLSNVGENVATSEKHWTFHFDRDNYLTQKTTWLTSENLVDSYLFMVPINRVDSIGQITDTSMVAPLYVKENVAGSHSQTNYVGDQMGGRAVVYGKDTGFFSDVTVLEGWNDNSRYFTSTAPQYNKMYFDFSDVYTTSIGEVFNTKVMFEIGKENNTAPLFTTHSEFVVDENEAYVGQIVATDTQLPKQTHTYSITGGADASKFTIEPATGKLYFVSAPDYENPTQAGDVPNKYVVEVTATDNPRFESLSSTQTIDIYVLDVDETTPPVTPPDTPPEKPLTPPTQPVIPTPSDSKPVTKPKNLIAQYLNPVVEQTETTDATEEKEEDKSETSETIEKSTTPTLYKDLRVKVYDKEKKPVKGATVELHSKVRTEITDENGEAYFKNVEVGKHTMIISYKGQKDERTIDLTNDDEKEEEIEINVQLEKESKPNYWLIGIIVILVILIGYAIFKKQEDK
ncbi:MAG TPA: immunoglobulin-like domain-containing protein [Candidatus Dojkabacteria bacterium]|nr:immunoglobulin-like domain-containing protein [Candidatus Dojkabacteria bacterium]